MLIPQEIEMVLQLVDGGSLCRTSFTEVEQKTVKIRNARLRPREKDGSMPDIDLLELSVA
jgi:hypothetical protein